jgi:hypothetical protein
MPCALLAVDNPKLLLKWRNTTRPVRVARRGADLVDESTKNNSVARWTADLVIRCLEDAFRSKPDAAMFSMSVLSDSPSDRPIEGAQLIQATALALGLGSRAHIHILYHARSRSIGEPINKLCETKCWIPATHYSRVIDASMAVAEWLNARAMQVPALAEPAMRRGPGRPPKLGRLRRPRHEAHPHTIAKPIGGVD